MLKGCFGVMKFSLGEGQRSRLVRLLNVILLCLVVFEAVSLACWLLIPFFPSVFNTHEEGFVSAVLNSEAWLFYSSVALAPVFVVLMLFSWVPRLLAWLGEVYAGRRWQQGRVVFTVGMRKLSVDGLLAYVHSALNMVFEPVKKSSRRRWLILALAVILALSIEAYPHLPAVNPSGRTIGVDVKAYATWLTDMNNSGGLSNAFSLVFFNLTDRSLGVFLMYLGWKAVGVSAWQAVEFLPLLLSPLLVLATFFFMRKAGFNFWAASLASLFAAFSFHATIGTFGGFLSNWLGLLFVYLSLGFLLWSMKELSWLLLGVSVGLQIALLFVHLYTWEVIMAVLAVFFLIDLVKWVRSRRENREVKMIFAGLAANVLARLVSSMILSVGLGSVGAAAISGESLSLLHFQNFWSILQNSLWRELGISFMNPLLFSLAVLGAVAVSFRNELAPRFLTAYVAAVAAPFVFGDSVVQTRLLYDLPVHLFSLLGLALILKLVEGLLKSRDAKKPEWLLLALVILANLNYAFRCSNYLAQNAL